MLAVWTELLPLFVIRWIAKRYCERVPYSYEGRVTFLVATARPDVLIKLKEKNNG